MRSIEVLEENPLTGNEIDFEEVIGFVIMASTNLGIAEGHWQHLVREMVLEVEKTDSLIAEEAYFNPSYVKDGLMSLSKWTVTKAKLSHSIDRKEKLTLMGDGRLSEVFVTEKQAVGYMILAAKKLHFLHEQIKALEMEVHYLLITTESEQALDVFLDFIEN
ncbi:hypothetical protein HPY28_19295 [Brevibacillus sp. HB1.2]|uniref:hypothetical protein n=1 Tax=Brevibacillus sp. HB1.2 TaxID=2738807 RepID=UPI00157516E4|nr:hypothetical protein [Brevibacillus sp. HB1.2]NTU22471.1 hypothetical protein [Brevibacillus sp. HB1.2]